MDRENIKELREPWEGGVAKSITFIVTKDCQLACKYCYLVGKNDKERMSLTMYGGKGWIVVNNSHVIFAIDPTTFKVKGQIENLTSPRSNTGAVRSKLTNR